MTTKIEILRELLALVRDDEAQASDGGPWKIGTAYFIRTVTYFVTGRLQAVYANELVLTEAAWIADTGRFHDALKDEKFSEVEPFPADRSVIIGRNTVIDAVEINKLPLEQC